MNKYKCDKKFTLEECELTILRLAVDNAEQNIKTNIINSPNIQKILIIVETFLKNKQLVVYGGTAINSILPIEDQFYNKNTDLPDYDIYSYNAFEDSKALANLYYANGFTEVEAKTGIHCGTYKIFVNFIPIADITFLNKHIFNSIKKEAIIKNNILYAPPNFLRMSLYLELSRPEGDVSRWEKVLKRITLLNKNFPLKAHNCKQVDFQRKADNIDNIDNIYDIIKNAFISEKVVFFGGYAISLYSQYMPYRLKHKFKKYPDFDVLSIHPNKTAENILKRLESKGIKNVSVVKKSGVGEIISEHYEIIIDKDTVAFIYKPLACHSYNVIHIENKNIKIATIDTMLSFYLAFLYANREYYDTNRILCMSQYLFKVQQQNRLEQKGLLKRFSIHCYGHQETLEEIRAKKTKKFMNLKKKKNSKEYEKNFLRYRPIDIAKNKLDIDEEKQVKIPSIKSIPTMKSKTLKREKSISTRKKSKSKLYSK
jgi:hypothetical protein